MNFRLQYTQHAYDDLDSLERVRARRIVQKLDFFVAQENPLRFAKRLINGSAEYRFRVGDYRVLFDLNSQGEIIILLVLRVKHRREVYD